MTRPSKITAVTDSKDNSSGAKYLTIALCCMCFALTGCPPPEGPLWKDLKIGDLAPRQSDKQTSRLVESTNFYLYIFEMPSDNVDKLQDPVYQESEISKFSFFHRKLIFSPFRPNSNVERNIRLNTCRRSKTNKQSLANAYRRPS